MTGAPGFRKQSHLNKLASGGEPACRPACETDAGSPQAIVRRVLRKVTEREN